MFTKSIIFKNVKINTNNIKVKNELKLLLKEDNAIIQSLKPTYKNNYNKKKISKLKNYSLIRIIGMGGSILGTESIYNFLKHKIKKSFIFINNLSSNINLQKNKKIFLNLIVSKSGNTLETISNVSILTNRNDKNVFIIGGRFSVLSEVGMLPAELMGLNVNKFKQINNLIKNKKFINSLINNVSNTIHLVKNKKANSIILNYDEKSHNLFEWYQQLVAESLGKKGKGILPIISTMPKDNHSIMQLYLDGSRNNFFTFY